MERKIIIISIGMLSGLLVFLIGSVITGRLDLNEASESQSATITRFTQPKETRVPTHSLEKLPGHDIHYPVITPSGNILYYEPATGYIHLIEHIGNGFRDSTQQRLAPFLTRLTWSKDRTTVIGSRGNNLVLYNLADNTSRNLDPSLVSAIFSPFDDTVTYLKFNTETKIGEIGISNDNLSTLKRLFLIGDKSWDLSWLNTTHLLLTFNTSTLFTLNTETKALERIINDRNNIQSLGSGTDTLLFSSRDRDTQRLAAFNTTTSSENSLPIETTASRCAWSVDRDTVYCSQTGNNGASDQLSVINTKTQTTKKLAIPSTQKIQIENLLLSVDEKYLFIKNSLDGAIYRLPINY